MTENLNNEVDEEVVDVEKVEAEKSQDIATENDEDQTSAADEKPNEGLGDKSEWPEKFENAYSRKKKQINKLRAQMRELEAKLNEQPEVKEQSELNPDDFDTYGDYMKAQFESLLDQRLTQSQSDMQKQQLTQQKEALKAQRDQYIIEQANEAAQTLQDLPQVWQQNAHILDALPKEVEDIFYSIDNAPAAVYTLAKEGKLESLLHANPAIAAYEIVNAQNRGLEMLSKPQKRVSQAPQPISKAKGTGSVKKQLSPNDDVLKSLGLKK